MAPHVLRWPELELLCCAIAAQDSELPYPGALLLLLYRFAPICEGHDVDGIVAAPEPAWREVGAFTDAEIMAFIERVDARDAGFRWRFHEPVGGWCLEQEDRDRTGRDLYTLRRPKNANFPFEAWSQMLAAAEQVLTRSPAPAPASGVRAEKSQIRSKVMPREKHSLELDLPLCDPERPLPQGGGRFIATTLDRILRDCSLGAASVSGSISSKGKDGFFVYTKVSLGIKIKGDLQRGVALIRDVLWWAGAPEAVSLSRYRREKIPLELAQPAEAPGEFCFQVSELRTVPLKREGRKRFRIDRVPFTESCRKHLRSILTTAEAEEPDEDGWRMVTLPDGETIRTCFRRLDEDPDLDGGTITAPHWSPAAAEFVYRILAESELMLLPVAITASEAAETALAAAWPKVQHVRSAAELYHFLAAGPYPWWVDLRHPME